MNSESKIDKMMSNANLILAAIELGYLKQERDKLKVNKLGKI